MIVVFRIIFPGDKKAAVIGAVITLFLLYEIPALVATSSYFKCYTQSLTSTLFMLPQFVTITIVIIWVNVNPELYDSNIGTFLLGGHFYAETVVICGWLVERCFGREIDFIPTYPHFLVSVFTSNGDDEEIHEDDTIQIISK